MGAVHGFIISRVSREAKPPSRRVSKRSEELHIKMKQIYQHNVCFREGIAGVTETVQEGKLILIAENSEFSAGCYLVPGIA